MAELSTIEIDGTEIELVDETARAGLSGKVDKETGMGLSSNDYTAAEKAKLASTGHTLTITVGTQTVTYDGTADASLTIATADGEGY